MSFAVPQRLPDFNNNERRKYENWTHSHRAPRSNSIHTYKDKPFYGGVHPTRRKRWYTSKWFLGTLLVLALFYLMHQLNPGTQRDFNEAVSRWTPETDEWEVKRERVKQVFLYSWKGYVEKAWGKDEYRPISGNGKNMIPDGSIQTIFLTIGMGWIIIDALDTMMLMNLTEEVSRSRTWIAESLNWDQDKEVNVFETTIRVLGGLLSAHYLSGNDDLYLEKAVDLADRLITGFDSPTGIPYANVNLKQRVGIKSAADGGASTTAEVSTLQLEFKYLSKLTGETLYWETAEKVIEALERNKAEDGLVPIFISPDTGQYTTKEIRLGSRGDSYYGTSSIAP
jgi:endoplasmic reticulum Man9GlcNAc2 1,2-alpha-mannosidase